MGSGPQALSPSQVESGGGEAMSSGLPARPPRHRPDGTCPVSNFYRAMLSIRGTSHGPVSVRPSVRHKSEFYRNGERIELGFGM